VPEAHKLLDGDLNALESWLSDPKHKNDCLQFVRGCLMVSPSDLAKRIREELQKRLNRLRGLKLVCLMG
jgi:hypothetical protein